MEDDITLEEFTNTLKEKLDKFALHWEARQAEEGTDAYAEKLEEPDWFENFTAYLEVHDD